MASLEQAGICEVISLRVPDEAPTFDEAAAMRAAGIAFHNLPTDCASGLTRAQWGSPKVGAGD
ncbi:MAG: hypothetical protein JSR27_05805 [Proteobacteria bacterium]|nr:hypothetical protein [Pseudomonadota bacterium]